MWLVGMCTSKPRLAKGVALNCGPTNSNVSDIIQPTRYLLRRIPGIDKPSKAHPDRNP